MNDMKRKLLNCNLKMFSLIQYCFLYVSLECILKVCDKYVKSMCSREYENKFQILNTYDAIRIFFFIFMAVPNKLLLIK